MPDDVEVKHVESQPVAVVRRRASAAEFARVVPQACGEVWNFVRAAKIDGAGRHVAVDYDGETNLKVGVEVPGPFTGDGNVFYSSTPAGTVATTVHMGPYHRLGEAHAAIQTWCADHHRTPAGPQWEIYGHWTDDASQLRTDVFYLRTDEGEPTGETP
jgi:effector-binding domain-containing protein